MCQKTILFHTYDIYKNVSYDLNNIGFVIKSKKLLNFEYKLPRNKNSTDHLCALFSNAL
jgi:hypothetical protein